MKFRNILYACCLAAWTLCAVSCSIESDDIRVERLYGVETEGATLSQTRLRVRMEAANDSRVKVTLRQGLVSVTDPRGEILTVSLDEPVALPRRSVTDVSLPLTVRFRGGFGAVTALARLGGNPDEIRFSGSVQFKGGGLRKNHRFDQLTLRQFLEAVGAENWEDLLDEF